MILQILDMQQFISFIDSIQKCEGQACSISTTDTGCPSKPWTFVITQDCVQLTLCYLKDVFIYTWETSCINMGGIAV